MLIIKTYFNAKTRMIREFISDLLRALNLCVPKETVRKLSEETLVFYRALRPIKCTRYEIAMVLVSIRLKISLRRLLRITKKMRKRVKFSNITQIKQYIANDLTIRDQIKKYIRKIYVSLAKTNIFPDGILKEVYEKAINYVDKREDNYVHSPPVLAAKIFYNILKEENITIRRREIAKTIGEAIGICPMNVSRRINKQAYALNMPILQVI